MPERDPELDALFTEPSEREVIDLLRAAKPAEPPLDPYFRNYLRAKLMTEARHTLTQPSRPRFSLPAWMSMPRAGVLVAAAAALLLVVAYAVYGHQAGGPGTLRQVAVSSPVKGKTDVALAEPIKLRFSGPVDKAAVEETIQIQPATQYATRWEGQTLIVIPAHPLSANTSYTVTVKPKAAAAPQAQATSQPPVAVRFVTAPTPPPPVVPPSYQSQNLQLIGETPATASGAVAAAAWTPDGQLLVVRPSGRAQPSPTASASASPAGSPAAAAPTSGSSLWLMSPQGTFTRELASDASLPAVASHGNLFAYWQVRGNSAALRYDTLDIQGSGPKTVATLDSGPSQAPLWIGSDRLAYVDSGTLRIVDLNGSASPVTLSVNGSVAAAPDGQWLAAQTPSGPVLFNLASSTSMSLPDGASEFSWSAASDLAFVVDRSGEQDLWVMRHGGQPHRVQQTTTDRAWTGLSWAPDGSSILFASLPGGGASGEARAFSINADGSALRAFGRSDLEYREPRWSPQGSMVLFVRSDESGGFRLWLARVLPGQLSAADRAQADALNHVQAFMQARLKGDQAAAQAALGPDLKAAVQAGTLSLTPPDGSVFVREYVVSVQLVSNDQFLVGVRLVLAGAANAQESSFFEEQLTVVHHPDGFLVDSLTRGKPVKIGRGPTVISVEVQRSGHNVKVMVHFDADLDPSTVSAQTVEVLDGAGHALTPTAFTFDRDHRLVSITAPAQPGTYKLLVTSAVTDINGQAAQSYTAPLVVSPGT